MSLPDFEAWAIFATVADRGSFSAAAQALGISKATVSKAVSRLEAAHGTTLFHRSSRRVALSESGKALALQAKALLEMGREAEELARADAAELSGAIRLAAPMALGVLHIAPALAEFEAEHPHIRIELHLSDERTDIIGGGYDLAVRIANLPDSALRARRLGDILSPLVASPDYIEKHGRPEHPVDLSGHACLTYTNLAVPDVWSFEREDGEQLQVRVSGPLATNSGDAMLPALRAELGIARLPGFFVDEDIAAGRLVALLPQWTKDARGLHLLSPPGRHRPARVDALAGFLAGRLARICRAGG
ncbi:MAG: LysR substrate-binding domain-containing protein [Parasphingopyxis sp.]